MTTKRTFGRGSSRLVRTTASRLPRALLSPEHSAQGRSASPNPLLSPAIDIVRQHWRTSRLHIGDLGCGKLRHFKALAAMAESLVLIDTARQLKREQRDHGLPYRIGEWAIHEGRRCRVRVSVLTDGQFQRARLRLHAVFCIAVLDVVPLLVRRALLRSAKRNLRPGGILVLIIPRNDVTILRRCTESNRWGDGYVFRHHGVATFYANFRDSSPLLGSLRRRGFFVLRDLSNYRQVGLVV